MLAQGTDVITSHIQFLISCEFLSLYLNVFRTILKLWLEND